MDANVQAELDEIYQASDNPEQQAAAEEQETDAADDESAAPEADEAAADESVEEETEETADESEESDESADETETDEPEESASFDDLLQPIPSNETLLARNTRVPQATKDELVNLADGWRKDHGLLDRVGGEQGVEILAPVSDLLSKSERTFEDHSAALGSMLKTNALATMEMVTEGALGILFNTDNTPIGIEARKGGDVVLQKRFGDGVTAQFIEEAKLLSDMRKENGYVDFTEELTNLKTGDAGLAYAESQNQKLAEKEEEIARLKNLVENPHLIEKQTQAQTNAVKELDDEIVRRLSEGVTPFRERVRWGAESALTKIVGEALLAGLKADPEYREAVNFVKQYGSLKQGDIIPYTIEKHLSLLINKGKARFGETSITINKELRGITESSRNAKVKEKVKETVKPKPQSLAPQKSYEDLKVFAGGVLGDALTEIYRESDAKRAAG